MVSVTDVRAAVLGRDRRDAVRAGVVAVGLFVVALASSSVTHLLSVSAGGPFQYLLVVVGIGFAVVHGFRNAGLLVCWALVSAPVAGTLAFYTWLTTRQDAAPVALPLSFYGHGAVAFWIPTVLVCGTFAFALGVLTRRAASLR
ncbi:hypothetical protein ACFPM1_14735 [Halorubrum rubrum]|uniref:Uncharacterized protein n=1 Tax=Halorubrum rubrum TaxID=1126240 RepID=A0ABD5R535_9EURY|nr:hypothetical protein [Halorubrum rubrum]